MLVLRGQQNQDMGSKIVTRSKVYAIKKAGEYIQNKIGETSENLVETENYVQANVDQVEFVKAVSETMSDQ